MRQHSRRDEDPQEGIGRRQVELATRSQAFRETEADITPGDMRRQERFIRSGRGGEAASVLEDNDPVCASGWAEKSVCPAVVRVHVIEH